MMTMHGRAGPVSGAIVEDDVDVRTTATGSRSPTDMILHSKRFAVQQPTLLGLQRPIATRPSDTFYAATEKANIPFLHVHEAVKETHDWENKWLNRMNEVNPLDETDSNTEDDALWSAAIEIIERDRGARNPSPTDPRISMKRSLPVVNAGADVRDHYHHYPPQPAIVVAPTLVRPKAMRVNAVIEPQMVQPTPHVPNVQNDGPGKVWIIPHYIKPHDLTARSLSPITTKSGSTSSSSTGTRTTTHGPQQSEQMGTSLVNVIDDDDEADYCVVFPPKMMNITKPQATTTEVLNAREGILYELAASGGETTSPAFMECLTILQDNYMNQVQAEYENTSNINPYSIHEGTWLTLTKPTFFGCLGENDNGDPLYSLGRMTFDMFTPSDLICSLQGNFNTVHEIVDPNLVPEGLLSLLGNNTSNLRTYHIITAFTIEPSLPAYPDATNKTIRKPIRGLLTTTGYMMTDTSEPDVHYNQRNTLWITGGIMEPNDTPHDTAAWKALFGSVPPRTMVANAKLLAMKWLLGAVVDDVMDPTTGSLQYSFTKPIGGQGKAYSDTLYADSSLRIIRGHRGTLFVFSKQPEHR